MSKQALEVCRLFVEVIHSVEGRCMAADGPVTKTCDEITDEELRRVYVAATAAIAKATGAAMCKQARGKGSHERQTAQEKP